MFRAIMLALCVPASGCAAMGQIALGVFNETAEALETVNDVAYADVNSLSCTQQRDIRDYLVTLNLTEQGQARLQQVQWEILQRCG